MDNRQKDFSVEYIKTLEELTLMIEKLEREVAALKGEEYVPQTYDNEPIDLSLEELPEVPDDEKQVETVPDDEKQVEPVPDNKTPVEPEPMAEIASVDTGLFGEAALSDISGPAKKRKAEIHEVSAPKGKAIMDVLAEKLAWYRDMPGSEVKSLRSAIGLGDQVIFIKRLFRDDSALYQDTIEKLNAMRSLDEAVGYINVTFPEWDMESDDVYRFMMAVRRKGR